MPTSQDFKSELHRRLADAQRQEKPCLEVDAGKLHRAIGRYPAANHRMRSVTT
jgi:hypothetical protein